MRLFTAIFLLVFVFALGGSAEKLPEEQKLEKIQKQLRESKRELRKTKEEEQAVLGRLVVITKELKSTENKLYQAQEKIRRNEAQIGHLTSELDKTEKELREEAHKLKNRVKEVYKSSGLNYVELLLSSHSMSDFLNRLSFFRRIIDYDANLVQKVHADVQKTRQKKALLQNKTEQIRDLAKVIADKKQEIASKVEQKKELYQSLKRRREEYEARVAELEKSSKELEVLILKKVAARRGEGIRGSGRLAWPLQGRITSRFGYRRHPCWGGRHFHTGIDIAAKYGSPVSAADAGEVIFAGWWDGYGKAIVVDHGRRMTTVYAHLSRIYKRVGEIVAKGQILGLVGSTGYSTGPHLHFEVRMDGKPVDPLKYL